MLFATIAATVLGAESASLPPARPDDQRNLLGSRSSEPWGLFWDGIDILDAEDYDENTKRFGPMTQTHTLRATKAAPSLETRPRAHVEVIGLQDTGTNLLAQLLYKNFGSQVVHFDSTADKAKSGVWKHANMAWIDREVPNAFENMQANNVVPLVMVRNPLSWLQSIKKAPYELSSCVEGEDWLNHTCVHKFPAGYVKTQYGNVGKATFNYLSGIWGRWTESYSPVLTKNFKRVMVIRYEDLVLHTKGILRKLASELDLKMPKEIDIMETPAKSHGAAVGHEEAVRKIKKQEYLKEYSKRDMLMVCMQMRPFRETMVEFHYDDCIDLINSTSAH